MSEEISVRVHNYGAGRALALYYRDPVTGKRKVVSAKTTDPKEAERKAAVLEAELRSGRYAAPSKTTWQHFRERFASEKLASVPKGTRVAYTESLDHLARIIGPDKLAKITAAVLSRFAAELRKPRTIGEGDKKRARPGLKLTSVARHLRHIKAALRWAERQGIMVKAPAVEMPKLPKGESRMKGGVVVAEQVERMLAAVPKVRPHDAPAWRRLIEAAWLSSLRLQELLALSWEPDAPFSVDLSARVFRIESDAQKSRRTEAVPMFPDFAAWLAETPEAERVGPVLRLPSLRNGKPLAAHRVGRIVAKIGRKAGVVTDKAAGRFATCHDLRRGCLSRWARKVSPAVLQRMARHAHYSTTAAYYVHLDAADVAAELWAQFGPAADAKGPTYNNPYNNSPETTEGAKVANHPNPLPQ
jgi:integrase